MVNPRSLAVKILIKIEKDNAYSNLTLNAFFEETEISDIDKAFVTNLVYGVIERKITLDYVLKNFIKTPLKKILPITLNTLRVALYQIMFMDKIPESAAVNEAVKGIKKSKENRNSGFVNAVLRNILRSEKLLPDGDSVENLSIIYSCPCEIIESFINDYGLVNTKLLLEESLKSAPFTVRVNTLKTDVESFVNQIGVETKVLNENGAVELMGGFSVGSNTLYKNGLFFVQDMASQTVVTILNPQKNERMLDMCAAPGGKSFSSAILMKNTGEIVSCDLYEHKCQLIKKSAERLGLDIIKPAVCDATVFNKNLGLFDCILCDVPCSGLGIIRRKPEIKYKDFNEFDNLPEIAVKILNNAKNYLKPQGRILYSTCTLRKAENECVIEQFLKENPEFSLEYSHTFMPHTDNTDGFYCALLKSK